MAYDDVSLDPREPKLPVWVQDKLAGLRRRIERLEQLVKETELATDPEGSEVVITRFDPVIRPGPIGLGRSTITFKLPNTMKGHERYVEADVRDGWVYIRGSDGLVVRPSAANSIYVRSNLEGER